MLRETADRNRAGGSLLLHALRAGLGVDQSFKDSKHVAAVFDQASEDIAKTRLALGLAMPFNQHRLRNLDVPAQLFGGMPPKEQAVEEGRLPLREVEIVLGLFGRVRRGWKRRVGVGLH